MPYPTEHAARVRDPGNFIPDSFRSKELKPGIRIIIGKLKFGGESTVTQAYRFSIDNFTVEEARQWLKDNKISFIKFEPAKEEPKEDELKHYGVLGMRWGVRNAISTAGARVKGHIKSLSVESDDHKRYASILKKRVKDMSDEELTTVTTRLRLVKDFHNTHFAKQKGRAKNLSNEDLKRVVDRDALRKSIVKNSMYKIRLKDFLKVDKMSDAEVAALSKRLGLERNYFDLKTNDLFNAKRFLENFLRVNPYGK